MFCIFAKPSSAIDAIDWGDASGLSIGAQAKGALSFAMIEA
jgi:hypothetical protein